MNRDRERGVAVVHFLNEQIIAVAIVQVMRKFRNGRGRSKYRMIDTRVSEIR